MEKIMTSQTRTVINFFQKAFPAVERDPEKYLTKYRSDIEAAGRVFQYLELAKPDSKSALGWKPTKRLLDLIAKSDAGPPKTTPKSVDIQVLLDLMMDTILGSEHTQGVGCFCVRSLIRLGLVDDSDCEIDAPAPTIELLNLFTSAYYARAWGVSDPNIRHKFVLAAAR
jgi:hypothetical protein